MNFDKQISQLHFATETITVCWDGKALVTKINEILRFITT